MKAAALARSLAIIIRGSREGGGYTVGEEFKKDVHAHAKWNVQEEQVNAQVYVCMYAYEYVNLCKYMYIYIYITYIYVHTYISVYIYTCIYIYVIIYTCIDTHSTTKNSRCICLV